jgi:hypothetical protein
MCLTLNDLNGTGIFTICQPKKEEETPQCRQSEA